jgi:hypothetical protein
MTKHLIQRTVLLTAMACLALSWTPSASVQHFTEFSSVSHEKAQSLYQLKNQHFARSGRKNSGGVKDYEFET